MARDFLWSLPDAHKDLKSKPSLLKRLHLDGWLLLLLIALMLVGLSVIYSATGGDLNTTLSQAKRLGAALIALVVMAQIPPRVLERWAHIIYFFALLSLVAVLVLGVGAKGAQRWLDLGFTRFQPSEIMKLALPLMLAAYLAKQHLPPSFKTLGLSLLLLGLPTLLIAYQPDLGTGVLVASAGLMVLFLAGLSWRIIASFFVLALGTLPLVWSFMRDYQKQRVLTFLNPESDPLGSGWNIIQSKTAIGSGGLWGKGWLNGTQSRLDFLPEKHTDFIIGVLAEEAGFIGVSLLIILYALIIWRCLLLAMAAQTTFSRLLAGSITLTFFVYIFVNLGMVSGLLPVVGIPLPLISYGGSASLVLLVGFGILMSIHTHEKTQV